MPLPYGRQTIEQDDIDAVVETLQSDFLTTGPKVGAFEEALCEATAAKEAVVCGNGTQALHLACIAAGIEPGDCVIVPTLTFLATANAPRYCGADVIFADVDPQTGLMNTETLSEALSRCPKAPKAILPVHLNGQSVDLSALRALDSLPQDTKIIADSCHALGGSLYDKPIGACDIEDFSTFSFHPVKTIAMGEGGAITTNDPAAAKRMRALRSHGMEKTPDAGLWAYSMDELGYNYRVPDILCALGVSQLKKLTRFVEARTHLMSLYSALLEPLAPHITPIGRTTHTQNPAWHLCAVHIDFEAIGIDRSSFMMQLLERNIGSQVHYIPVHSQAYYNKLDSALHLPGAQRYYDSVLSLPLYPSMQEDDVHNVVKAIKDIITI